MSDLETRHTQLGDLTALRDILNYIIAQGGTTAHLTQMTSREFRQHYFEDPLIVHTVLDGNRAVGFQAVFLEDSGEFGIASFTDQHDPVRGAGRALIAATRNAVKNMGGTSIIAEIRADNIPGLAYYSSVGFVDETVNKNVPLQDGTLVDRKTKRLVL